MVNLVELAGPGAVRGPGEEIVWALEDTASAIERLVSQQIAVLGGELWFRDQCGSWANALLDSRGRTVVYAWSAEAHGGRASANWEELVQRFAGIARETLLRWQSDPEAVGQQQRKPFCSLTLLSESEWREGDASIV